MKRIFPYRQSYEWGTYNEIPDLLGLPSDGSPYAEAWYGSHPSGPSHFDDGSPVTENLSFLLKILSARKPLSIQAHPPKDVAARKFSAGHSAYSDDNHKPETIVAVGSGMEVRAGIRDEETLDNLLRCLGVSALLNIWRSDEVGTTPSELIRTLLTLDQISINSLLLQIVGSVERKSFITNFPRDRFWTLECTRQFTPKGKTPHDIGIAIQLMMNYARLDPGTGLHMPAGELHAYLKGTGIEIMANSDNVLRAGLTSKPLAVDELIELGSFDHTPPRIDAPTNGVYRQEGVDDYRLTLLTNGNTTEIQGIGIVLSLGRAILASGDSEYRTAKGESFMCDPDDQVKVECLDGTVYVATSGETS